MVEINATEVGLGVSTTLEAIVAGIDQSAYSNTNDAPEADEYDRLRALGPDALEAEAQAVRERIAASFYIDAGTGPLPVEILQFRIPDIGDVELPRDSLIIVRAALPPGTSPIRLGWAAENGALIIKQKDAPDDAYTPYLAAGELSEPYPREARATEAGLTAFLNYIVIGFEHIIPKGLDHILFVLGLFLFSLHMRPLLIQITAFTLAHTVTLALATLKIVSVPASIVEPLIALSIAWVAVENVLWQRLTIWRTLIVFCFGLLHGLGFASVLGDIGLSPSRFITGLIGFNIGVELGQLSVIALAYVCVAYWFGDKPWYRRAIVIPASLAIAAIGIWWAIERSVFA